MNTYFLFFLLSLATCVSSETFYLRRLSDVYNSANFTTALCGSFRNECIDRNQEKHAIFGKEGEYPSKYVLEYSKYSDDLCFSTSLLYTLTVSGSMSNHKTLETDTFSVDIDINSRVIKFSQEPSVGSITCENTVELNKEYSIDDMPCTLSGVSLYENVLNKGVVSKTIYMNGMYMMYDYDNSTKIDSLSKDECEALPEDNSLLVQLGIWLGVLFVLAVIGMLIINCFVEKKAKEVVKKSEEEEEYSDYSDEETEEVKKEEVKEEEVKTEEVKTEEVKEEEVKTEEVKTEEVKTEEVKTEEVKTEEVKTEEIKTEEAKTEETKAEANPTEPSL